MALVSQHTRARTRQPQQTREKIIDAAISGLHRLGYSATTTIFVAQAAAVSRGAMLHHFPTKSALMAAVVRTTFERDAAFYRKALAHAQSHTARIDMLVDCAWARFKSPDGIAQVEIWQATRSDPELAAAVTPVHDEVTANSQDGMHQVLRMAGPISRAQSRSLLLFTVATLRGLAMELALGTAETALLPGLAHIKHALRTAVGGAKPRK
jgi:AcrR family transcriptional regulator